ncbi:MAG TPA: hypothetical protein VEQ63_10685, partial [Bryobacteraceae bacterium]|nr:hypothetical protein [Bryobacteraceae bacterium]
NVPLQVQALGTRQVGEVICTIQNPDISLLPGTNVNADIRSSEVAGALTIPKEALRRQGNETGVLKLEGERVVWKSIRTGVSSVTRVQVLQGLVEGDPIALPIDQPINAGDAVRPVLPRTAAAAK